MERLPGQVEGHGLMKYGDVGAPEAGVWQRSHGSLRALWWMHPRFALLYLSVPLLFFAYLMPENSYLSLYGTEKYIDLNFLLISLLVYTGFVAGSFFRFRAGTESQEGDTVRYCSWVVWPLFALTLTGYLVWFTSATINAGDPSALLDVFTGSFSVSNGGGDSYYIKQDLFQTIPGITTLTQLGILYVTVEALLWVNRVSNRRVVLARFAPLLVFTLVRALLISERLALMEIAIPLGVVLLSRARWTMVRRSLVHFAPVLGGAGVFALFAAGEYFRSWSSHYQYYYNGTYLNFALERFLGYYATALNNAAVHYYYGQVQPLSNSLDSLFKFPVLGGYVHSAYLTSLSSHELSNEKLLTTYANIEFNNVSMVGLLLNDFTVFLAPLAAFVIGMVSVSIYTSFIQGRMLGLLLYPSWFIGLLEMSRIYYWPAGRYFPVLAFLAISFVMFRLFKSPAKGNRTRPAGGWGRGGRRLIGGYGSHGDGRSRA